MAFKKHLAEQLGVASGEKLSKATLSATLNQLKKFFQWLSDKPGYKSRCQYSDADYFNLSGKDTRIAAARREQKAPTVEQIKHVIETIPTSTEIERRNRALIAFTLLTGRSKTLFQEFGPPSGRACSASAWRYMKRPRTLPPRVQFMWSGTSRIFPCTNWNAFCSVALIPYLTGLPLLAATKC
jgi:hypothetical protein